MRPYQETSGAKASARRGQRPRRAAVIAALAGLTWLCALAGCEYGTRAATPHLPSTPTASIAPIPTYTPLPPTPTPTTRERVLAAVAARDLGTLGYDASATYDAGAHVVSVVVTIAVPGVPNDPTAVAAAHEQARVICFRAEHTLWTSDLTRGLALREVTVTLVGPILAQYADLETAAYAAVVLSLPTETRFAWNTLTPDAAWGLYDNTYLRPDFNDAS